MILVKGVGLVLVAGAVAFAAALGSAWIGDTSVDQAELAPAPPTPGLIQRGAYLAKLGDCAACHSVPGQPAFSGGYRMSIPIGAIYSTNITPDPETGIGNFSLTDFDRALRYGVSRGHTLYPAMPFASYANTRLEDVQALYAYFKHGVRPASVANRGPDILFPLSLRFPLTYWRWLFAPHPQPFDAGQYADAEVARGAYFVEGLGHCGECHTPRALTLQVEATSPKDGPAYLSGAVVERFFAPSLRSDGPGSLVGWDLADVATFLKTGVNPHGIAFGSMTDVIEHSTQFMTADDLDATARYLKSIGTSGVVRSIYDPATAKSLAAGDISRPGARVYINNCAACHRPDGRGYEGVFPALAGNPVVEAPDPTSLETIVLRGSKTPRTQGTPAQFTMPGFAWRLNDAEVADVVSFIRSSWGNHASVATPKAVAKSRDSIH
jgi:alcohol dehydrogenase (quinone), cytochrome c subunit